MQTTESPAGQTTGLLFDLAGARYAVSVSRVFEILWLPELTPVAQAPFDTPGIFNLRGRIVTVIDLNLRLGYRAERYRPSNRVIVLADGEKLVGIIVDAVREVRQLDATQISDAPDYGLPDGQRASLYISHVARIGDEIITLLDEERLLHYSQGLHDLILEANMSAKAPGGADEFDKVPARDIPVFCPEATPEEREIFRKRARNLLEVLNVEDHSESELLQLAVLALGRELFAIELNVVLEFTDIKNPTQIPCTPDHIVGCMNLRGEILTIVDIRGVLNLGLSARTRGNKLVVARIGDITVGVVVDDVLDIRAVPTRDLHDIPSAVRAFNKDFLRGAVSFGDRFALLLDLPRVIREGGVVLGDA